MARILRILAVLVIVGTIIAWAVLGANRGWTKTKVQILQIDPVTEIEFATYEDKFVPGVDFLAAGLGIGLALGACSVVIARLSSKKS